MQTVLAQVNWEQAGIFVTALIVALGGQRGLEALIVAWRGKRGPSANETRAAEAAQVANAAFPCVLHAQFEKNLDERHQAVLMGISGIKDDIHEVKESVSHLNVRIDQIL
ncbi:MAG: hypothetical protein EHM80_03470 [Nitrospiraceae bacterium]|nr:MAG: hypothetical protein EHM80_15810 [Nitrospiraceae bacterium]RPH81090.1 MAG: hypothetical protein EHM80_03470 [Nitrospiraceae bacterium]